MLATQWEGVYAYEIDANMPGPREVRFRMDLSVRGGGRFNGQITEEPPGIPELATIEGVIERGSIRFSKTYGSMWIMGPDGQSIPLMSQPSHLVQYHGELSAAGNQIEGTWRIEADSCMIDRWIIDFPEVRGTWTANAVS